MALIQYITQVQFDFGAVSLLRQECEQKGISRPLVVTDVGVRNAGVLQKALDALAPLPCTVFDGTPSNPTEAAVRAAAAALGYLRSRASITPCCRACCSTAGLLSWPMRRTLPSRARTTRP